MSSMIWVNGKSHPVYVIQRSSVTCIPINILFIYLFVPSLDCYVKAYTTSREVKLNSGSIRYLRSFWMELLDNHNACVIDYYDLSPQIQISFLNSLKGLG
jgi:hypothetical protein